MKKYLHKELFKKDHEKFASKNVFETLYECLLPSGGKLFIFSEAFGGCFSVPLYN